MALRDKKGEMKMRIPETKLARRGFVVAVLALALVQSSAPWMACQNLTASPKMAVTLAYYLTPCSRPLGFAGARQFCQQLLATPVMTELNAPPVTLDYFLQHAAAATSVS